MAQWPRQGWPLFIAELNRVTINLHTIRERSEVTNLSGRVRKRKRERERERGGERERQNERNAQHALIEKVRIGPMRDFSYASARVRYLMFGEPTRICSDCAQYRRNAVDFTLVMRTNVVLSCIYYRMTMEWTVRECEIQCWFSKLNEIFGQWLIIFFTLYSSLEQERGRARWFTTYSAGL